MSKRYRNQHQLHDIDYIFDLLDRGFSLEFIAKDAEVQVESIKRRIERYIANGGYAKDRGVA